MEISPINKRIIFELVYNQRLLLVCSLIFLNFIITFRIFLTKISISYYQFLNINLNLYHL